MNALRRIRDFLEMIKVSHTVFALPFAVGAAFLAAGGMPAPALLGKIVLAVLCARTAAMSFNRWADRRLDAVNPRTASRALPAGTLSPGFALAATLIALAGFIACAWWINSLAFALSPAAATIILGYSYCKRFTWLCHAALGLALALAPLGAWVAVTGRLEAAPLLLAGAVLSWTAGFDILYACLDAEFDRAHGLHSLPARVGVRIALRAAAALHALMLLLLGAFWWVAGLGPTFLTATAVVAVLLAWEHSLVRADDLSRVNRAFFTMNGIISFSLMVALIAETLVP